MTDPQHQPSASSTGGIPELIASIGTFLTFSGTVTESSYLPGFQRNITNRRLVIEDHGVQVKTIVGGGWAADIQIGDSLALRGPIKGYEIGPRGLIIVLQRTRPIHLTQLKNQANGVAAPLPAWPPTHAAVVRRRYRSRRDPLLRAGHAVKKPGGPHDQD